MVAASGQCGLGSHLGVAQRTGRARLRGQTEPTGTQLEYR